MVPPRFLLTGLFPGAPRLVHSGLMEKYRHLRLALEQAKVHQSSVLAGVRTEAQLAVQEAVNALYGDLDAGHDSVDSLAGLVARLWPLSAANSSRSAELVASSDPGCGAVPGQPGEESGLRSPKTFVGNPANEPDWHRAFARSKLSTDLLLPLVGIIAGVRSEAIEDRIRGSVRDARSLPVERFSLRLVSALLCSLQHPSGRPDVLHDLLVRQLPLALPTVSVDASSEIEKRLEGAFFGSDDETGMVTAALVFALSNWWAREPSAECPLGWEFDSEVERSTPWRRALPPLHSKAWLSWTGAGGLLSPLEWLLHGGARSPVLKTALGFPHALDVEWRHQAEDRLAQRAAESERPWASAEPLTPIRTAIAEAESQVAVPRSTLDEVVAGRSDAVRQPEIRLLRVGLRDWLSVGP
ncbi:MAG: hypothetical protein DWQ36_14575 [Acidobacteria bacterium]|nr:MAG: hypothetical protein DWQ30_03310 [Acidobacteriota bacterium]REK06116.1 MAG: hypothetical protein DWQ36_14575 [Acidobacteriota bacterium]